MNSPQGPARNPSAGPNSGQAGHDADRAASGDPAREPSAGAAPGGAGGGSGLPPDIPDPIQVPRSGWLPSLVWLIPLIAALIGVALVVKASVDHGPIITISFSSAEGLEGGGKTKVKYKDVDIGSVRTITLSKDRARVIVEVQLTKEAENFAVKDTRFWVVRPRIGTSGVSGLNTLLSGAYIGVDAGKSAETESNFVGLETPPAVTGDQKGHRYTLRGDSLGSLDIGRRDHRRVRPGAVRPVRRKQLALVACERCRSAPRFERPEAEHAVARDGDRRRYRVPVATGPAGRRGRAWRERLPAVG
jgi:paraquat-inducible protein B